MPPKHRLALIALLAVVALVASACDVVRVQGPRSWTMSAELAGGKTFGVNVRDLTGRVESVEVDPPGANGLASGPSNPAGRPNVLVVPWTGGACDVQTDVEIGASGEGLAISIATRVAPGDCDAIGVGHTVVITGRDALPAGGVVVTTKPGS